MKTSWLFHEMNRLATDDRGTIVIKPFCPEPSPARSLLVTRRLPTTNSKNSERVFYQLPINVQPSASHLPKQVRVRDCDKSLPAINAEMFFAMRGGKSGLSANRSKKSFCPCLLLVWTGDARAIIDVAHHQPCNLCQHTVKR